MFLPVALNSVFFVSFSIFVAFPWGVWKLSLLLQHYSGIIKTETVLAIGGIEIVSEIGAIETVSVIEIVSVTKGEIEVLAVGVVEVILETEASVVIGVDLENRLMVKIRITVNQKEMIVKMGVVLESRLVDEGAVVVDSEAVEGVVLGVAIMIREVDSAVVLIRETVLADSRTVHLRHKTRRSPLINRRL